VRRIFRFRFRRTRWGGVALFPARRFLWGVEFNFMTDSWDCHAWPFWVRISAETLELWGDYAYRPVVILRRWVVVVLRDGFKRWPR